MATIPTFVGKGTFGTGTGAVTPGLPANIINDDVLFLFVESANQSIATPTGWTQIGDQTSATQGTGTAAAAGGVRLAVFWRVVGGLETAPSVADSGDHTNAIIIAVRGADPLNPVHNFNTKVDSSATTAMSWPTFSTTVGNTMIIMAAALDQDLAGTAQVGAITAANLASIVEQHDQTVIAGAGGGLTVSTATKASAGALGTMSATGAASTTHAYMTLAIQGQDPHVMMRGQYKNDATTIIPIGGATAGDGISNNVYLKGAYSAGNRFAPITPKYEKDTVATSFSNTADASEKVMIQADATNPARALRGTTVVYDDINKRLIQFGGYNGTTRFNTVWERYIDKPGQPWRLLTTTGTPPAARNLHGATIVKGNLTSGGAVRSYMVIWGGADPADTNGMWTLRLDTPGSEAWASVTQTSAPSVRSYNMGQLVATPGPSSDQNYIYLYGGWAAARDNGLYRCTFDVDAPTAVTWTTLKASGTAGNPPQSTGAIMDYKASTSKLYLYGGYDGTTMYNTFWEYDIAGNSWTNTTPTGTAPTGSEAGAGGYDAANNRFWFTGGWTTNGTFTTSINQVGYISNVGGTEAYNVVRASTTNSGNQTYTGISFPGFAVVPDQGFLYIKSGANCEPSATDMERYGYIIDFNEAGSPTSNYPVYSENEGEFNTARDAPATIVDPVTGEWLMIGGFDDMYDDCLAGPATSVLFGTHSNDIWAYKPPATNTYYFDASDAAASDPNSVWTGDANAFDGSIGTKASITGNNGSNSSNYIMAEGTTAPNGTDVISQVRARIYSSGIGLAGQRITAEIYTDGLAENLGTVNGTINDTTPDWSTYTTLTTPTGGWTYEKLKSLEVKAYRTGASGGTMNLYRVEIEVTSGNTWRWANAGWKGLPQMEGRVCVYDSTRDRFVLFGGLTAIGMNSNEVWTLTRDANNDYVAAPLYPTGTPPSDRWLSAAVYDPANDRMIIAMGGDNTGPLGGVFSLSFTGSADGAWTTLSPTGSPTNVTGMGYADKPSAKRLYIFGGATNSALTTVSSQLAYLDYSTTNCAWTVVSTTGAVARRTPAMSYDPGMDRLVVFGGFNGTASVQSLGYLNLATTVWEVPSISGTLPDARRSAISEVIDGVYYLTHGRSDSGMWYRNTWSLRPDYNTINSSVWSKLYADSYNSIYYDVTGLTNSTGYHWQGWVTENSVDSTKVSFGNNAETVNDFYVGTPSVSAPTVTGSAATNIDLTTATAVGNVTADGNGAITERGFVLALQASADPTTGTNVQKIVASGTTGDFTGQFTKLDPNTPYKYRPYAINSAGTTYGSAQNFTSADYKTFTVYAVMQNTGGGTTYLTLWNRTDGTQVYDSEMSTTSASPVLVTKQVAYNATGFVDAKEYEFRMKVSSGTGNVYSSGMYIKLKELTKATTFNRVSRFGFQALSGAAAATTSRFLYTAANYSSPTADWVITGTEDTNGTNNFQLYNVTTTDSGTTGSGVAGTSIDVNSTSKVWSSVTGVTLTDTNRYLGIFNFTSGGARYHQGILAITASGAANTVENQVQVEMLDTARSSQLGIAYEPDASRTPFRTDHFDGATYYFEVVGTNSHASNAYGITLVAYNKDGTATDVVTQNFTANTGSSNVRYRTSSITIPSDTVEIRARIAGTAAAKNVVLGSAKVVVVQTNATKTLIHVPMGGSNNESNDDSIWPIVSTNQTAYNTLATNVDQFTIWKRQDTQYATYYEVTTVASFTKTHSTDAMKRQNRSVAHTSDANRKKAFSIAHTTSANLKKSGITRTHTTGASIRKPTVYSIQDTFNDNSTNTSIWNGNFNGSGNVMSETGGRLQIQLGGTSGSYSAYARTTSFDLTGSSVYVQAPTTFSNALTSTQMYIKLEIDATNFLIIGKYGANLYAQKQVAGVDTVLNSISYNTTNHAWWRISEYSGTLYFETSTDGTTWLTQYSFANPFAVTALKVSLGAGTFAAQSSSTVEFDNFNTLAPSTITKTHTTDANKRKATTATHTTDANKKKATTKTHTTDAWRSWLAYSVHDNFNDNTINSAYWTQFSGATEQNNRVEIISALTSSYRGFTAVPVVNLTGSQMSIQLVNAGNQSITSWEVYPLQALKSDNVSQYGVWWYVSGGNVQAWKKVGGTQTQLFTATYSSTTHQWFRIRESGGTVYWDTSADSVNWTNRASELVSNLFSMSSITQEISAGTWQAEGSTTVAYLDNYNLVQPTLTHSTDAYRRTGVQTLTRTHTTDSLKRKQFTLSHTTDANKKKSFTKTHTTDSNKRKATLVSHITDANKKKSGITRTHTTDALLRKQFTKTHTTDSLKRKQFTLSHTTDSLKRKQFTLAHTTDANKKKVTLRTHTTDANKRLATLKSHTTDANKRATGLTRSHTTSSVKVSSTNLDQSQRVDTTNLLFGDASVQKIAQRFTPSYTGRLSAIAAVINNGFTSTDTLVMKVYTNNSGQPGTLLTTSTNSADGNSLVWSNPNIVFTFTFDQLTTLTASTAYWFTLERTGALDGSNNWLARYNSSSSYGGSDDLLYYNSGNNWVSMGTTSDLWFYEYSVALTTVTKTHSTDANKRKATTVSHTTDANKKVAGNTRSHTTDANKKKAGLTVSHTTSANLRKATLKTHTTDANKRVSGFTKTHTTDANKKVSGITRSHTTDSFLRKQFTKTHTTDANKRKATLVSHTTDANKKKSGLTRSHTTDANKKLSGNTRTHTTDALKRLRLTLSHTTDSNKKKSGNTRTHTTDALKTFPLLETLIDNFNDNSLDSSLWSKFDAGGLPFSRAAETNSRFEIELGSSASGVLDAADLQSNNYYSLVSSYLRAKIVSATGGANRYGDMIVLVNGGASPRWSYQNGQLLAQTTPNGGTSRTTVATLTYNSSTHLYWRIRESGGAFFWDTSPDGNTWTQQATNTPTGFTSPVKVQVFFEGGATGSGGSSTLYFDDVNVGKLTTTRTHTTDAFLRKAVTKTHTTDANKRLATLKTHTTDANKKLSGNTRSHTTDALKRKQFTLSHSTNSLLRKQFTKTHTTDALKRAALTRVHTTDANKRKATLVSHTTDANKKKSGLLVSHTTDANKRKSGLTVSHTTNALLRKAFTKTHTTDSLKRKQFTVAHSTDSLLRRNITKTHTTDANKRKATLVSHATDTLKRTLNTRSHSTDAFKRKQWVLTHSTDSFLRKANTLSHTTDSNKRKATLKTHTTDSNKRKATLVSHTTDANRKKTGNVVSHTTDANKRISGFTRTHSTDAFLRRAITLSHSTDANKKKANNVVSHTTDSLKRTANVKSHTTDSFLRKANTRFHTTDANLKKSGLTKFHTTDSNKRKAALVSHTTDANKKRSGNLVSHTTDSNKRKAGLLKTHTTDSLLRKQFTKSHSTDAFKRIQVTKTHTTDSFLRRAITKSHTTDSNKRKATLVSHTTDALKRSINTRSHTTDALKRVIRTVSHTTDSLLKVRIALTHSTDSFLRKANTRSHSTDANLRKATLRSHTTDANKKRAGNLVSHTTDSNKRKLFSVSHSTDSLKRTSVTKSHTTDSLLRRLITRTHTTDSLLRKQFTKSHSTDANKRRAATVAHLTDANKRKSGNTVSHTTDANKKVSGFTRFHTTDSFLRRQITRSHTTDANKKKVGNVLSHSTSAFLRSGFMANHNTDANKRRVTLRTHTTDALLRRILTLSHTTSSMVRKANTVAHTTDSNRRKATLVSHTTDSNKRKVTLVSHLTDANKRKATLVSHSTDSNKRRSGNLVTHTTSSVIRKARLVSHTTDTLKRKTNILSHSTSSFLRKGNTRSHTTDSNLRKVTLRSHTTDAFLRGANSVTHSTSANKRRATLVSHSTDASKNIPTIKSHQTDALKRKATLVTHTTDSLLRKSFTVSHNTDANLKKAQTRTHKTDAFLRGANGQFHTTDANKRKTSLVFHKTDSNKKKLFFVTHSTDSFLRRRISIVHSTDANLKRAYSVNHSTDANRRKFSQSAHSTDALIRRSNVVTHLTDAYMHVTLTVTHATDSVLRKQMTASHTTSANKRRATLVSHSTDSSLAGQSAVAHTTDANLYSLGGKKKVKVNGQWVNGVVKVLVGSEWKEKPVKYWTGSYWKESL